MTDIAALKVAATKASHGPWEARCENDPQWAVIGPRHRFDFIVTTVQEKDEANAAYIALANPSTILSLIASHELVADALEPFASMPCETLGAEDLEVGCCRTCRARTALQSIQPVEEKQS